MEEQELNRKLAEWAGLEYEYSANRQAVWIKDPDTNQWGVNRFSQSLDACFKWLVPQLQSWEIGGEIKASDGCPRYFVGVNTEETDWSEAGTPALALCLAIEKLIVKEEK